jgi:hypothetical protein
MFSSVCLLPSALRKKISQSRLHFNAQWLQIRRTETNGRPKLTHKPSLTLINGPLVWDQFNMAIDSSGRVYGSIELWNHTRFLWDSGHKNLVTVSHVQSGDYCQVSIYQHDSTSVNVWDVQFWHYENSNSTAHFTSVSIPSQYYAPISTWQLNIAGENSGSNPDAVFTSGGANAHYYSFADNSVWMSTLPSSSCAVQPGHSHG